MYFYLYIISNIKIENLDFLSLGLILVHIIYISYSGLELFGSNHSPLKYLPFHSPPYHLP
jgi:hypothetical protein